MHCIYSADSTSLPRWVMMMTTKRILLVKKRKKSESEAEAGTVATNGDAAKKPHIEAVATNGNGHTNGH